MSARPPYEPLIAIIGATGTGKSKLAVELALRFNGEIINGDAMQMYKGLPIITNKIPDHERHGVPHHLLDFIELHEPVWTVTNFVQQSQRIIREIRSRGKLPILVGGSHYYVHGLLFNQALVSGNAEQNTLDVDEKMNELDHESFPILTASTEEIYAKLQEVDPAMARRWHPKDRRKISRSLQIFLQTGQRASDIYEEQKRSEAAETKSLSETEAENKEATNDLGNMRYSSLIFWLEAQDAALKKRLDTRVLDMIANGLVQEAMLMADFERDLTSQGVVVDKDKGIWVSIGYKELAPLIGTDDADTITEKERAIMLSSAIEAVQVSTRQYAKRQRRYVRLRLANALHDAGASSMMFVLDCSDLEKWADAVTGTSQDVTDAFLRGKVLPDPSSLSEFAEATLVASKGSENQRAPIQQRICEVCDKTLMTKNEWEGHLASRGHRKALQGQRKRTAHADEPRALDGSKGSAVTD